MRGSCTVLARTLAIMALPLAAHAFVRHDFDQRYFIEPGYIVKDHTLVEGPGGTQHLFYIKADENVPEGERAKTLGHATSTDLVHWTVHPDVIPVVPNTWEESFVWAPHVVQSNGVWYMFYTGVNRHYAQAIGVAVSPDLFTWYKHPLNPVYRPSSNWAAWSSTTWSNCRDPYVFFDNGLWYMTTTAHTLALKGAISLASSPDLVNWMDLGPLLVHPGPQAWHVLESSNVHKKDGAYHLFMTEQNIGGATHMSAPTLAGPWNYAARQPFDAGHATEIFQRDGRWMLSRHTTFSFAGAPRYTIKFDDLDWDTVARPIVHWRDPLSGWTQWSGDAFYLQPTFWDNTLERGSQPAGFGGNSWVGTAELFTGPLQVGYPGLTAGNEPKGIIRSPIFVVTGDRLKFRIGGGNDLERLYLALYTADDHVIQRRATGQNTDTMTEYVWNISAYQGQMVYLEVADLSTGAWGHINIDEIQEYEAGATDTPPTPIGLEFALHQNTPNPFNPTTKIAFDLPAEGRARLTVFDVRGRLVRVLADERYAAGSHTARWDGRDERGTQAASGIYLCRLDFETQAPLVRSMLLLK